MMARLLQRDFSFVMLKRGCGPVERSGVRPRRNEFPWSAVVRIGKARPRGRSGAPQGWRRVRLTCETMWPPTVWKTALTRLDETETGRLLGESRLEQRPRPGIPTQVPGAEGLRSLEPWYLIGQFGGCPAVCREYECGQRRHRVVVSRIKGWSGRPRNGPQAEDLTKTFFPPCRSAGT